MNEYKKLYNQIDKLNNKIKKLEFSMSSGTKKKYIKPQSNLENKNILTLLNTYQIYFPNKTYSNKKYVGLMFGDNLNTNDSDEKSTSKNSNLYSFIKLNKSNIIINYSIQLELNFTPIDSILCSVALGIKTIHESKIKIIRGTKKFFDLANSNVANNKILISDNVLYSSEEGEELCIIVDFDFGSGSNCTINSKKSIIKLLNFFNK